MKCRIAVLSSSIFIVLLASLAPGQGWVASYGNGCGTPSSTLTLTGTPEPGFLVTAYADGIGVNSSAWLLAGISNVMSIYGPLPFALPTPSFGTNCQLLTSVEAVIPLSVVGGVASMTAQLPPGTPPYDLFLQVIIGEPNHASRVSQGLHLHVASTPPGTGDVAGAVRFAGTNAPAPGVRMTLFKPDLSAFFETRTAVGGTYNFTLVPAGSWQLGAALPGSAYQELTLSLTSGATLTVDRLLAPETQAGTWATIGTTLPEFFDATDIAVLRIDGTIFFCHDTMDPVLFDPVTAVKTFPGGSGSEQGCMNASLLADGSALLCGGQQGASPGSFMNAISWVKRFHADTTWQILGNMLAPTGRWYPGLARLADGRLLVFGGGTAPAAVRTDTTEVFDPGTSTWTSSGVMGSPNEFAPAALLYNGKVLRTWGSSPELWDPPTGQWAPTGPFVFANRGYPNHSDHALVVLTDGRALALGVRRQNQPTASMSEYYDPTTATWTAGTSPSLVRFQGEVIYLPDGKIWYGAGEQWPNAGTEPNVLGIVKRCDLFDPVTQAWRRVADALSYREYHAVTVLVPDGRVITTGGSRIKFQYGPTTADIDAWSPPCLFRGIRPQISNLSDPTPARGQTVTFDVFPNTSLTGAVLMGVQSHTHWVDGGIPRRLVLPVVPSGSQIQVTLPTDANLLPLGWYMLFAMVDDIPSKALIIRVDP